MRIWYDQNEIDAIPGERLLDAILRAGIDHRHICGGHGFCTSCRVEICGDAGGLSPVSPLERDRLGRDAGRLRLACQTQVNATTHVRPPPKAASRFSPEGE